MQELPVISFVENPDDDVRKAILEPLTAFNAIRTGPVTTTQFALTLRGSKSGVIGGLWGVLVYDWLYIELVYIPEELRGRGLGTALLGQAEALTADRGCIGVRLDTFSFQAPAFYEKLGYRAFGRLENLPKGHERIYYTKPL